MDELISRTISGDGDLISRKALRERLDALSEIFRRRGENEDNGFLAVQCGGDVRGLRGSGRPHHRPRAACALEGDVCGYGDMLPHATKIRKSKRLLAMQYRSIALDAARAWTRRFFPKWKQPRREEG